MCYVNHALDILITFCTVVLVNKSGLSGVFQDGLTIIGLQDMGTLHPPEIKILSVSLD